MDTISHYELAKSANRSYDFFTFSESECEVLIEMKNHQQVIAIRGTEGGKLISGLGILDIIRDMMFIPWYNSTLGWVHCGFLHGALKIFKELNKHIVKGTPVVLTGHSLGAAMALIISVLLRHHGYTVVEYVGFACPRTFVYNKQRHNKDVTVRFPITIYRYETDIVPMVPFAFPYNYHHPVEITQIGDGFGIPSILDHSMYHYEDAMLNI